MKKDMVKISSLSIMITLLLLCFALLPIGNNTLAFAKDNVASEVAVSQSDDEASACAEMTTDGKYKIEIDTTLSSMSMQFFDSVAYVEKIGDNYYLSYTVKTQNFVENWQAKLDGKDTLDIGVMHRDFVTLVDGKPVYKFGEKIISRTYTYALTKEDLSKTFTFSMFVTKKPPNGGNVSFTMKPRINTATRIGDVEDRGERPAPRIPVIVTAASDTEWEKGTDYTIAPSEVTFLGEPIDTVSVSAYYVNEDGTHADVTINNGKINLANSGEYHVVYKAQTDSTDYVTSLGNSSYAIHDIKIISKYGAVGAAKVTGANLPKGGSVQTGLVGKNNAKYRQVETLMATIADKFTVYSIFAYDKSGKKIGFDNGVIIGLKNDKDYDFQNLRAYYLREDGTLYPLNIVGNEANQYINIATSDTGYFVLCEPGVEYRMPMKILGPLMLLGMIAGVAIIVVPIVIVCKKKKKKAIANGTYVSKKDKKAQKKANKQDKAKDKKLNK